MEKLMKTSKTVDTILKVVFKILQVAGIIIFVGVGICLVAEALGQLPPAELAAVSFGDVELRFTEPQIVDNSFMAFEMGTTMIMVLIAITVTCYLIKVLRKVLVPMIKGQPFDGTVSKNIKKLGIVMIAGGLIMDILGRIPEEDEHPVVEFQGVEFTVVHVEEHRIAKVHAKILPKETEE